MQLQAGKCNANTVRYKAPGSSLPVAVEPRSELAVPEVKVAVKEFVLEELLEIGRAHV